jgi:hypothetical protein
MAGAGVTVVAVLGALLPANHLYFWYGDTAAAYYGWWYHLGDLVRHGQWGPIDPSTWRAGNFAAEGQWGLWSPLTIAIGLVATAVPNLLLVATGVKLGLAVTAALGVFRVVRSYDAPPAAAYVAAVVVPLGGMTQYVDLPAWVAGEMIWAIFPWVWWAVRRTLVQGTNPLPALALGYLLVTVGYVYGTIMLVVLLVTCLFDCWLRRDRAALLRALAIGVLLGLVALTVYLPGVATASVTERATGGFGGFRGQLATDPSVLFSAVLPTAADPGASRHVLPYAYLVWFLPVAVWLDWGRARREWRPLGGLLLVTGITFLVVDGPSRLGPLRWPMRLQPFLVETLVVLLVVAWTRFAIARPSPRRLGLALAWVGIAGVLALLRVPSMWAGHLGSVALVGAGIWLLWWLHRSGRRRWLVPAIGAVTVAAFALQHVVYPTPAAPQRHAPTRLADYQRLLPHAVGDVLAVGPTEVLLHRDPRAARYVVVGSSWYLNRHPVQNTYTAISYQAYRTRYCIFYQGATCRGLIRTLFTTEPTTGRKRVDLLGVSSLLLVRGGPSARSERPPPPGWRVAGRTPYTVLWTRRTPVPGAGGVAWTSPGTTVSSVRSGANGTSFHLDAVPAEGGTVVLSLLDWPGYRTDVGSLADPVDGYLVTVHVPASAGGSTVHVGFHPPGWNVEIAAWALALLCGAGWSLGAAVRRRRRRPSAEPG